MPKNNNKIYIPWEQGGRWNMTTFHLGEAGLVESIDEYSTGYLRPGNNRILTDEEFTEGWRAYFQFVADEGEDPLGLFPIFPRFKTTRYEVELAAGGAYRKSPLFVSRFRYGLGSWIDLQVDDIRNKDIEVPESVKDYLMLAKNRYGDWNMWKNNTTNWNLPDLMEYLKTSRPTSVSCAITKMTRTINGEYPSRAILVMELKEEIQDFPDLILKKRGAEALEDVQGEANMISDRL